MATQTRYAAKSRILNEAGQPTGAFLYYRLKAGAPAPGRGGIVALSSDWESISEAAYNAMSTDCAGVSAPLVTYTFAGLWARRAINTAPVNRINFVAPKYEKGFGITTIANAYGPCYAKLEPLAGQNFADTGYYAGELFDGTGYPGSFRHIYADSMPVGRYLATWKPEGSNATVSAEVVVSRTGSPPYVAVPFGDWNVTQAGAVNSKEIAGTFVDPDGGVLTYTADANGQPLPSWLSFNATAARPFTVAPDAPNTSLAIVIRATDPDGQSVTNAYLLSVNRRVLLRVDLINPTTLDEGTGVQLTATAIYSGPTAGSEVSEAITLTQATLSLAGPDGAFTPAFASLLGVSLGTNGLLTAGVNSTQGDTRTMSLKLEFGGKTDTSTIQIIDKTTPASGNPPGTEACANYAQLTQAQFDALPQVVIYAYAGSSTARPFASRNEAISLMPTQGQSGSSVGFSFNKVSQAGAPVNATLYNDNRPEHIANGTAQKWPVEAGFLATGLTLPANGQNGSYVLLTTNVCGVITNRETIIIPAN